MITIDVDKLNQALAIVDETGTENDLVAIEGFLTMVSVSDDFWTKLHAGEVDEEMFEAEFTETTRRLEEAGVKFRSEE